MPLVDVPDVGTVEFPDNLSHDEISSAIQRHINASSVGSFIKQPDIETELDPERKAATLIGQLGGTPPISPSFMEAAQAPYVPIPSLTEPKTFGPEEALQVTGAKPTAKNVATASMLGVPSADLSGWLTAILNTGKGLAEFLESPLGGAAVATGSLGAIPAAGVTGGFAEDIASKVPEVAQRAGEVSVTGTPQEKKQAYVDLLSSVALPAGLVGELFTPSITGGDNALQVRSPKKAALDETPGDSTSVEQRIRDTEKPADAQKEEVQAKAKVESPTPPTPPTGTVSPAVSFPTSEAPVSPLESIAKQSPEEFFKSAKAMHKDQGGPQIVAERMAQQIPDRELWEKHEQEARAGEDEAMKSLREEMSKPPEEQNKETQAKLFEIVAGANQKAAFFREGLKIIRGEKQPEPQAVVQPQPGVTPEQQGGGAAELGEIQQQSMASAAPTHGIAQRVREAQSGTGALGPEAAQPGQGIAAADSVEKGRQLLSQGLNPQQAVFEFTKTKSINADAMAVVRAHAENLWRAAVDTDRRAPNSPEAEAAWEAYNKWMTDIKPMQTEWHRIGQAQQGEVNLDDGSFVSMRQKFNESTGRDFTDKQKGKAHELSKQNEEAEVQTDKAQRKVKEEINKELKESEDYTPEELANLKKLEEKGEDWPDEIQRLRKKWLALKPGAEKDLAKINYEREKSAFDSVTKLLRDKATRDANIENRKRVEKAEGDAEVAKIDEARKSEALESANERVKAAAVERAKAEREQGTKEAKQKLELAKIAEKREQKARDAAAKAVRDAAARRAEAERKLQANPQDRVWAKVRDYMGKGVDDFNDLVAKVATDLGMKQDQVRRWIAFKPRIKQAMDDAWLKKNRERSLKETARRWLADQEIPGWRRILASIPRIAFAAKVFGHGTVALGTHAPTVLFRPTYWKNYFTDAGKMYRMVVSPAYYEGQVQALQRQPTFAMWKRAGLQNDPFGWEDYTNPKLSQWLGPLSGMGNRGYFVLKLLRQDMADQVWNKLPSRLQKMPEVQQAIADGVNHATGITKAGDPTGKSHLILFAPRLQGSRLMWMFGDPVRAVKTFTDWKNSSEGEKMFAVQQAKEKAWVLGTFATLLAANQGFLSAIGSDQKVNFDNPLEADWLKFKIDGRNVAYGNPFLTLARMPARLWEMREGRKTRNVIYPDESSYKFVGEYLRSQASPFAQPILDLWFKSDWQGRPLPSSNLPVPARLRRRGISPYTWPEWVSQVVSPIPFEEAQKEVWRHMGVPQKEQDEMKKAQLLDSLIMGLTGSRIQEDWNVSRNSDTPVQTPSKKQ